MSLKVIMYLALDISLPPPPNIIIKMSHQKKKKNQTDAILQLKSTVILSVVGGDICFLMFRPCVSP